MPSNSEPTPSILIVSGLDPSGGAGFIADVRVCEKHGFRTIGVTTAATVQTTMGVQSVEPFSVEVISDQLRALLSDIEVAAVKIGMVATMEIADAIVDSVALTGAPVVWDPVHRPTSGRVSLFSGDFSALAKRLLPHVSVVTPNLAELETLCGLTTPIGDIEAMADAATQLADETGVHVVATGGHLPGEKVIEIVVGQGLDIDEAIDGIRVVRSSGSSSSPVFALEGARETNDAIHGTGCAFSSALACGLGDSKSLVAAAWSAKKFVASSIQQCQRPGRGGAVIL